MEAYHITIKGFVDSTFVVSSNGRILQWVLDKVIMKPQGYLENSLLEMYSEDSILTIEPLTMDYKALNTSGINTTMFYKLVSFLDIHDTLTLRLSTLFQLSGYLHYGNYPKQQY